MRNFSLQTPVDMGSPVDLSSQGGQLTRKGFGSLPGPAKALVVLLLLANIFAFGALVMLIISEQAKPEGDLTTLSEFRNLVREGKVSTSIIVTERASTDYVAFVDTRDMKPKWTYFESDFPVYTIPSMSLAEWLDLHGHDVEVRRDTLLFLSVYFTDHFAAFVTYGAMICFLVLAAWLVLSADKGTTRERSSL
jgi:hypothetical protein